MNAPLLTLIFDDGVDGLHVYYDYNTGQWSSDYANTEVSSLMIDSIKTMIHTHPGVGYTPYPLIDKLTDLADRFEFKLNGVPEWIAYMHQYVESHSPGVVY